MKQLLIYSTFILLAACSSTNQPEYIEANSEPLVYMSTAHPPANCKRLGTIAGPYVNNNNWQARNLHQVYINKTMKLGGNYLEKDHAKERGYVYSCPIDELKKMEETNKS